MRMISLQRKTIEVKTKTSSFVERIAMLVDGANMFTACRSINLDCDYGRLLQYVKQRGQVVRAAYFTAVFDETRSEEDRIMQAKLSKLVNWLDYNGYTVVSKTAKSYFNNATGRRNRKGNMDVEMVVEAIRISSKIDRLFLFTGDGDFKALIEYLQHNGVAVTVVSTKLGNQPVIAEDLRRQADEYIDLETIRQHVTRIREVSNE